MDPHSGAKPDSDKRTKKVLGFDLLHHDRSKTGFVSKQASAEISSHFYSPSSVDKPTLVEVKLGLSILNQTDITDVSGLVICYVKYDPRSLPGEGGVDPPPTPCFLWDLNILV